MENKMTRNRFLRRSLRNNARKSQIIRLFEDVWVTSVNKKIYIEGLPTENEDQMHIHWALTAETQRDQVWACPASNTNQNKNWSSEVDWLQNSCRTRRWSFLICMENSLHKVDVSQLHYFKFPSFWVPDLRKIDEFSNWKMSSKAVL